MRKKGSFFRIYIYKILLAISIFFLISTFFTHAATRTLNGGTISWDNNNFLNQTFWNDNPSTGDIIKALYGSGVGDTTAYTRGRTNNTCDTSTMSVNYIDPGINIIPEYLTGNTIYVLFSGAHTTSRTINLTGCSAIVGKGIVTMYSNSSLNTGMIYANGKTNMIIDNISINGNSSDRLGIWLDNNATYNTINHIHIYNTNGRGACGIYLNYAYYNTLRNIEVNNNMGEGIILQRSRYNTIDGVETYLNSRGIEIYDNSLYNNIKNIKSYSNSLGISLTTSNYNNIDNIETYNNNTDGISLYQSNYNIINNANIYNNFHNGIGTDVANHNIFNNIQTYNNRMYGISLNASIGNTRYNIFNNILTYNNNIGGVENTTVSSDNKYYGLLKTFENTTNIQDSYGSGFISGLSSDFPGVFSGGVMDTGGNMSRDYITNPVNRAGDYFLSWITNFSGCRSTQIYTAPTTDYSYGSGILTQKQPVIYSGTDIVFSGTFDPTKYIGSNTTKYTGSLLGIPTTTNITGFTVTGIANNSFINNYSLFGNIVSYKTGQGINTSTGIYITTGDGMKHIITQIYSGEDFATHFETTSILDTTLPIVTLNGSGIINNMLFSTYTESGAIWSDNGVTGNVTIISGTVNTGVGGTYILEYIYSDGANTVSATRTVNIIDPCMSGWNNNNFLTTGFWNNSPTTGNIICALYGNGTGDRTAYTQDWSGRNTTQCSGMNMNVIYIGQITFNNLAVNTIYVVTGSSTIKSDTNSIQINDCSAVVSNNSIGTKIYSTNTMTLAMIGPYTNKKYGIIDSIDIDGINNGAGGSHAKNSCGLGANIGVNSVTVNNMKIYNTNVGISLSANGILINNTQIYNNGSYGISIFGGGYNTINNTQVYNNSSNGIIIFGNSNYNTINNSQSYNNGRNNCGISIFSGQWNIINNTQIYNNHYGLCIYTPNNTIHKMDIYNNGNSTRVATGATNIKFYGQNKFFNNLETDSSPGSGNLSTGSSSDYAGLSRSNGSFITTGIMSWEYITNPINGSGNYFLPWTGTFTGIMGTGNFITTQAATYSYGSGILMQTQPVIYSGTTLITGGIFDSTKYIGSNITKLTGSLSGIISTRTNSIGIYTVQPLSILATGYTLFGNILGTPYSNTISTSTDIKLITGDGQKNIITQLYGSFATHFQTTMFFDQTPPTFNFNNVGGAECISSAHLTVTYAADTGVGLGSTPYSFDGSTRTGNATLDIPAQQPGTQTRTGRVRDSLGNSSYKVATFTFSDILPTANNFTGNANVSNAPQSTNWITQSNIREGIKCGNVDISYSGMVTQATKGVCTVSGSMITYTPNLNQTGTDSCTIQAKDNENNTVNTIVYRENIDTTQNCLSGWNNDNFLTPGFWSNSPSDNNIICALYGTTGDTNTAYTNLRSGYVSGSCVPSMTVLKTNNIPNNLTANTIYVLTGQNSIITGTINLNNCNAIISNTTGGTTFFITGRIVNNIMLKNQSKQFTIIDNIAINGRDDGYGGTHTGNDNGIAFLGATNNTVNNSKAYYNRYGISLSSTERTNIYNSQTYNNGTYGIVLGYSLYNQVINTKIYNNYYGIFIQSNSHRNILNNCQVYNNTLYGIILQRGADYNVINNSQSYNNLDGISLGSANYTVIHNSQLYNNEYGLETDGTGTTLNNVKMYNNKRSINIFASGAVIFYGNNDLLNPMVGNVANITTGYATDTSIIGVGRTDGSAILSGNISRDRLTNPINTSGNYLLARSYTRSNLWNYKLGYADTITQGYSYGSGTLLQAQPVIYSGTTLVPGGTFDPTKYIGSNTTKYTGTLLGIPTITNITGFTVTGIANDSFISKYSLFGEIISYKIGQSINTSTGIYITTGDEIKHIITQIYSGEDFATHFEQVSFVDTTPPSQVTLISPSSGSVFTTTNTNLHRSGSTDTGAGISGYRLEVKDNSGNLVSNIFTPSTSAGLSAIPNGTYTRKVYAIDNIGNTGVWSNTWNFTIDTVVCSTLWNNDNFITGVFWNTNPMNKCIIEALYGTTGDINTAYTSYRSGYTSGSCLSTMSVITTSNLPATLTSNTIYVLTGTKAIVPSTRFLATCSAVISRNSSGTIFYSSGYLGATNPMLYSFGSIHTIIDNISIDGINNGSIPSSTHTGNGNGLWIGSNHTSNHVSIYNQETNDHINGFGIYLNGNYSSINNSSIYNNNNGIWVTLSSTKNRINNIQSFNNGNGIWIQTNSSYNTINNSQLYNNYNYGIYIGNSPSVITNNVQIYNNSTGVYINNSSSTLFNNTEIYNNTFGLVVTGSSTNSKYYGTLSIFANMNSGSFTTISTGNTTDSLVQSLGRATGNLITTGTMSWNIITNPINTSGNYLLSWSENRSNIRGNQIEYNSQITQGYSFGSGILLQQQPIIWSGTTQLIFSGTYDPNKYIGSDTIKVTGELLGLPAATNGFNFTVTGNSTNGLISQYSLFGDITNFRNTLGVGTATGITLTAGDEQKRVVTQLFGTTYFATHFETNTLIDTTSPTFVFANNSGAECTMGILSITSGVDTGIGLDTAPYSFDGINRGTPTTTNISAQHTGSQTRTGRVRDSVGNLGYKIAIFTFSDTLPTANNFTGNINVGSGSKTGNWKTLSAGTDGACGNTSLYYSGIINQGSKGTCNIVGDDITYTPNIHQTGNDSCTIQIQDNENNTVDITVGRENIDTIVLYCGDGTIQTPNQSGNNEQCDEGSNNGNECSPTYNGTCSYCSTFCENIVLTGAYCGDNTTNGNEQCDGNVGCSPSCTRELVSCSLNVPTFIYSGSTATITGTVNNSRIIVSGVNFGLPDYSYSIGLAGNYSTGYTYNSGGIYQITMDVVHPGSGNINASCMGSVEVQYCGDSNQNGSESCDAGNTNGDVCSPSYGGTCSYCSDSCQTVHLTGEYCGDDITNGTEQCDGGNYCNIDCTYKIPSCSLLVSPLTGIVSLTGIFTISGIDTSWINFDSLTFGDGSTGNINTGTLSYAHVYTTPGIYTGIFTVFNIFSETSAQCSAMITVSDAVVPYLYCGDGSIQQPNSSGNNEQCDDGNIINNDGCSDSCQIELDPTATIIYTPTVGIRTSGNVLATLTGFSEPLTGINFTGHIFTGNGTFLFTFSDLGGNTGSTLATVWRIDKIPPTFSGAISGVTYATGVTLYFADNIPGVTATLNGTPYTNGTFITTNGTYTLLVRDIAGNTTGMIFIIQHAICGNGIVEGGELYDEGINNGTPGHSNTSCNGLVGQPSGNGGGGGGGNRLTQDSCPNGDLSPSYYDNSCTSQGSHNSALCTYTKNEMSNAYDRAYNLAITTVSPLCDANLDGKVTRKQLAKMMTEFTLKIMGKQPNTKILCSFTDTKNETAEMKFYMKTACQLGLMGRESNGTTTKKNFDPNNLVSRAEFGTVLSRLIFKGKYNTSDSINRYKKHLDILQQIHIITDISKPTMKELRGYILLMMKRTNDYITNTTPIKK